MGVGGGRIDPFCSICNKVQCWNHWVWHFSIFALAEIGSWNWFLVSGAWKPFCQQRATNPPRLKSGGQKVCRAIKSILPLLFHLANWLLLEFPLKDQQNPLSSSGLMLYLLQTFTVETIGLLACVLSVYPRRLPQRLSHQGHSINVNRTKAKQSTLALAT